MCDITHSYVWHDAFIRVTWLMHMCDTTHHMCDLSCKHHELIHTRDNTCRYYACEHDCFEIYAYIQGIKSMYACLNIYFFCSPACRVMWKIWMSHVTHLNESCHAFKCVMSHSHESCHICMYVYIHIYAYLCTHIHIYMCIHTFTWTIIFLTSALHARFKSTPHPLFCIPACFLCSRMAEIRM